MKPADVLLAIFAVALWGSNIAVIKVALPDIPPLFFLAIRFFLAGILLLPFLRPLGKLFPAVLSFSATICFFHFAPLFLGLTRMDAASSVILLQLQVPFAVILAAI